MGYKLLFACGDTTYKNCGRKDERMEFLKAILGDELYAQFEKAVKEHNEKPENKEKQVKLADLSAGEYVSKDKYSSLETDKGSVAEQLKTAQGLIEELKKGTSKDEGMQTKIGEYETKVSTLEAENLKLKTESALKVALLDAGAKPSDMDYLLFKATQDGKEIKLGEDGKVKGQEDLITGLKTSCPSQFQTAEQKKIQEHKLEVGADGKTLGEPKTLAEALKQQYQETVNNSNIN